MLARRSLAEETHVRHGLLSTKRIVTALLDVRQRPKLSTRLRSSKARTGTTRRSRQHVRDAEHRENANLDAIGAGYSLLLVDDPDVCHRLRGGLATQGFSVRVAYCAADALRSAAPAPPSFAVIALRLADQSGLHLIPALRRLDHGMRIVVLTSYPSIETAVEAIKLGAVHYLVKPARPQRIAAALLRDAGDPEAVVRDRPMSVKRIAWEYIDHVLQQNGGNVSATARALAIDRRTLQRKLRKRPVAE
jgi:two-component system response regulator RegA